MTQTVSYIDTEYLRRRICSLTTEQLVEKSFKVKNWMDMNKDNKWVQQAGKNFIHKLNATYTFDQGVVR
jgi:hypothetical protein